MDQQPRARPFAVLRIVFGAIWLVDAYFKWSPGFISGFTGYLDAGAADQPPLVAGWIHFWISIVNVDPHFFAIIVAIAETAIALSLLTGVMSKWAMYGGIAMTLVIWSTAEGFGGPYAAGSTDIGSAVIYALVFVALLLGRAWEPLRLDVWVKNKLRSRQPLR